MFFVRDPRIISPGLLHGSSAGPPLVGPPAFVTGRARARPARPSPRPCPGGGGPRPRGLRPPRPDLVTAPPGDLGSGAIAAAPAPLATRGVTRVLMGSLLSKKSDNAVAAQVVEAAQAELVRAQSRERKRAQRDRDRKRKREEVEARHKKDMLTRLVVGEVLTLGDIDVAQGMPTPPPLVVPMGQKLKDLLQEACALSHSTDAYNATRTPARNTLRMSHHGSMLGCGLGPRGLYKLTNKKDTCQAMHNILKELIKEYKDVFDVEDVLGPMDRNKEDKYISPGGPCGYLTINYTEAKEYQEENILAMLHKDNKPTNKDISKSVIALHQAVNTPSIHQAHLVISHHGKLHMLSLAGGLVCGFNGLDIHGVIPPKVFNPAYPWVGACYVRKLRTRL